MSSKIENAWNLSSEEIQRDHVLKTFISKPENYLGRKYFDLTFSKDENNDLLILFEGVYMPWNTMRDQADKLVCTENGVSLLGKPFITLNFKNYLNKYTIEIVSRLDYTPYCHSFIRLINPKGEIQSYSLYPIERITIPGIYPSTWLDVPLHIMFDYPAEIASADPVEYHLERADKVTVFTYTIDENKFSKVQNFILKNPNPLTYSISNKGDNAFNCSGWIREALKVTQLEIPSGGIISTWQQYFGIDSPWRLNQDLQAIAENHTMCSFTDKKEDITMINSPYARTLVKSV